MEEVMSVDLIQQRLVDRSQKTLNVTETRWVMTELRRLSQENETFRKETNGMKSVKKGHMAAEVREARRMLAGANKFLADRKAFKEKVGMAIERLTRLMTEMTADGD